MRRLAPALLLLAACRTLGPAGPDALEAVAKVPPSPPRRLAGRLSASGPAFSGTFEILAVLSPGGARMQILPDLGPKVLDLAATRERIVAWQPASGKGIAAEFSAVGIHPAALFGATLLEIAEPVTRERVTGARAEEGGWWIGLEPAVRGLGSLAFVTPDGRIPRRRLSWLASSWEVEEEGDRFVVRGGDTVLEVIRRSSKETTPDAKLFAPELPGGLRPW